MPSWGWFKLSAPSAWIAPPLDACRGPSLPFRSAWRSLSLPQGSPVKHCPVPLKPQGLSAGSRLQGALLAGGLVVNALQQPPQQKILPLDAAVKTWLSHPKSRQQKGPTQPRCSGGGTTAQLLPPHSAALSLGFHWCDCQGAACLLISVCFPGNPTCDIHPSCHCIPLLPHLVLILCIASISGILVYVLISVSYH